MNNTKNTTVKNAIMIHVGHRDWSFPKSILMETDSKHGDLIEDIAKKAFERYKGSQENKDVCLLSYSYFGNVELLYCK